MTVKILGPIAFDQAQYASLRISAASQPYGG